MTPARDICELLDARASSGRKAFELNKTLFTKISTVLQQRFGVSYQQAELLLADIVHEHEEAVFAALHDHVHRDDAKDAVYQILGGDE